MAIAAPHSPQPNNSHTAPARNAIRSNTGGPCFIQNTATVRNHSVGRSSSTSGITTNATASSSGATRTSPPTSPTQLPYTAPTPNPPSAPTTNSPTRDSSRRTDSAIRSATHSTTAAIAAATNNNRPAPVCDEPTPCATSPDGSGAAFAAE